MNDRVEEVDRFQLVQRHNWGQRPVEVHVLVSIRYHLVFGFPIKDSLGVSIIQQDAILSEHKEADIILVLVHGIINIMC